jgi:hypothetical protein
LTPPPIDKARARRIESAIKRIESVLEGAGDATDLICQFNEDTGRDYDEDYFRHYWRSVSLENFVRQAARPTPGRAQDVTREELIEILRRASPRTEDPVYEYFLEIFDADVALPNASNLLFWPSNYDANRDRQTIGTYDPTYEEIVDEVLSYRVMALPPPV